MGKKGSKLLTTSEIHELAVNTHFDDKELKKWYKGFIRDYPDGKLNKQQFVEVYKNFYKGSNTGKFAAHVFRTFDGNNDGTIDFQEFITALSVATRGSFEEKLRWAFSIYDIDGDGYVSKPELINIIASLKKIAGSLGHETLAEEKIARLFDSFDENSDGKLTLDEFIQGAQANPAFVKMLQVA